MSISKENKLCAELKSVEDQISNLFVRVSRGDFEMDQVKQQLEQMLNDVREGRRQIAQM